MKVLAVAKPLDNEYADKTIFLAGERKTFSKKVYQSKYGEYFIHKSKRIFFIEDRGKFFFEKDPESVIIYVTMSNNYTATVNSDGGIRAIIDYLNNAEWGVNVDKNFGRITMISGDSQRNSNTLKLLKKVIYEHATYYVNIGNANFEDFYGESELMKSNKDTKYDNHKHNRVLWSIKDL